MREYLPEKEVLEYQQIMLEDYNREIDLDTAREEASRFAHFLLKLVKN